MRPSRPSLRIAGARAMCMDEIPGLRRTAFRAHLSRLKKPATDAAAPAITGPLARCSTVVVRPHSMDALAADYKSRTSSLYAGVPGFEGALLLLNRNRNRNRNRNPNPNPNPNPNLSPYLKALCFC